MTERDRAHSLIDELAERDLVVAVRVLEALRLAEDPVLESLREAPYDDEPDDDDFDGGLTEARRDSDAGRGISTDELRRGLTNG